MAVTALRETDGVLTALNLRNTLTGEEQSLKVDALFVSVGREPQLEAFRELLPLTEKGYAAVGEDGYTPHPWLFAAGDCRKKEVRQLTTAAADGAVAALAACRWLEG
jgi:thioredoxin reductase (NADPH)